MAEKEKTKRITIKKESLEVNLKRSDLIEVVESSDGIVFNFKYGLHLRLTDTNMPLSTKNLMKVASDNFPKGDLTFDLTKYDKPVQVDFV